MTTDLDWQIEAYPPANRFVASYMSDHLLVEGRWSGKTHIRRHLLADSAEDVKEFMEAFFADPEYWPPDYHRASNLRVDPCPFAPITCGRFTGVDDIRKNPYNPHIPTQ